MTERTKKAKHPPNLIALIGFMGSGKSTVGRLLATRIGYKFVDLDALIEETTGKPIPEIFRREGEKKFREYESQLLWSLTEEKNTVISTGGGAPITEKNRTFFTTRAFTIFLHVTLEEVLKRTTRDNNRPLLNQNLEEIKKLYQNRLPVYRSLGITVKTDGKTPLEICEEILENL